MKNSYITQLFKHFNNRYFAGDLPEIEVTYSNQAVSHYGYFRSGREEARIILAPFLKEYQMALEGVLMHEMVHCYLWVKYGKLGDSLFTNSWTDSELWNNHAYEFLQIEKRLNKLHFGNTKGHEHYVHLMEKHRGKP